MDREFEGRDEEPVQLNASTSNVVVVDNVRRSNNTAQPIPADHGAMR